MYLRPWLRGQGWGRRLLTTAVEAAVRDGCRWLELDTTERQGAACRLYEAAGFTLQRTMGISRYYVKEVVPPDERNQVQTAH